MRRPTLSLGAYTLCLGATALGLAALPAPCAARTVVSLTFDDGSSEQTQAGQILDQRGLKGTFFINSAQLGTSGWYMKLGDVQTLAAHGHEIGGHTLDHPHLVTLSSSDLQHQICDDRAALGAWGFNPVSFAYPYGEYNSGVKSMVQACGYQSARIVQGTRETVPPADAFALRAPPSIQATQTLADMQKYVTDTENAGGGWTILTFHRICDKCDTYAVSPADLGALADWLVSRSSAGTVVQTIGQTMGVVSIPPPTLASISPSSAAAGGAGFTLTVTGSGFTSSSTVRWNGSDRATTYVSSAVLRAAVTSGDIASAGAAAVTVFNPAPGGGASGAATFTVAPPPAPPGQTLLSDSFQVPDGLITNEYAYWAPTGAGAVFSSTWEMTSGSLFASGGMAWTGVPDNVDPNAGSTNGTDSAVFRLTTKRADFGDVSVSFGLLNQSLIGSGAGDGVRVFLRYVDSKNSYYAAINRRDNTAVIKKVAAGSYYNLDGIIKHAVPYNQLQRIQATVGNNPDGSVTIQAYVDGQLLMSAVDNGSQGGAPLRSPGKVGISADNDDFKFDDFLVEAGTASVNPAPGIATLAPAAVTAGDPAFTLTVRGSGFTSGSVIRWNGSARSTTYVSASTLTASIPAGDVASSGTAAITVFNPAPGGGTSPSWIFTITPVPNPVPALASIAPSSATAGGPGFTLMVAGSSFISGSVVRWNGSDRATSYVSSTALRAVIPSADIALPGTSAVTVFNPAPGGGVSSVAAFTVYAAPSSSWTATGTMDYLRAWFTATALLDGKVLAVGGTGDPRSGTSVGTAELFDPLTGRWTATGSMSTLRAYHTATLLPDGRVLVAGGRHELPEATADLFDPATGSFTRTGGMASARDRHTATRLADGRVLVAGGFGHASAEIYDPPTGSWSPAAAMSVDRWGHTATLLPDGKVLVAGGTLASGGLTAAAEVYDPSSGLWSPAPPMSTARSGHTASLLRGGKVLVAGGAGSSAEMFDPMTGAWSPAGSMSSSRTDHTATLLADGEVIVAGGSDGTTALSSAELFDPASGSWGPAGDMSSPRMEHAAAPLPDGRILVAGGASAMGDYLSTTELFKANPAPIAAALSPSSAAAGGAGFTLTVSGSGFISGSIVRWNGSGRPTTYVGGGTLRAAVTSADIASSGTASVTVFNPAPGGGTTAGLTFVIAPPPPNPAPVLASVAPNSATAGGAGFTLTVIGSGFVNGSVARWNGSGRATTFVSSSTLKAAILSTDILSSGTATVTVFNPAPGGGTSAGTSFAVLPSTAPTVKTIVSLTFDDGSADQKVAAQLLDQHGLKGTFFVNTGELGSSGWYLTVDDVKSLAARGHDIESHTLNHADLTTLSVSEQQRQICDDRANLLAMGINAAIFTYPYNHYNSSIEAIAQGCGFTNGRIGGGLGCSGCPKAETVPPLKAMEVRTPEVPLSDTPLATIEGYVTAAEQAGGGWVPIVFHQVCNGSGCSIYSVSTSTLGGFLDWLQARAGQGTVVQSMAQTLGPAPQNPAPTLASLSPSSATAGGGGFTLTANGANFVLGSVVRWNGSDRATTFVSNATLRAAIPASDLVSSGTATVAVFNPAPGGGTSAGATFTIGPAPNPAPLIATIAPAAVVAGDPAFTLTVNGSGFISGSVVRWNGSDRTTAYVSGSTLTASIPASDVVSSGTATVTVFTPAPGGGTSPVWVFTITPVPNPVPALAAVSPSSATAGGSGFTLTVTGSGFVNGSVVRWNGSDRSTTYVDSGALRAAITSTDMASSGTATVTVFNPAPGGGTSDGTTFTIGPAPNPEPVIATIAPAAVVAGNPAFTLTVNGSNFISGSIVRWNSSDRSTAFISASTLTASIQASDVASSGTATVTVFNPAPGGGTSAGWVFTITPGTNPVPVLAAIAPSSATAGTSGFTLTVNGSNFIGGSVVRWNGSTRATTYVSSAALTAVILSTDIAKAGTASVTVFNPAPGGGTSAGASFTIVSPTGPVKTIVSLTFDDGLSDQRAAVEILNQRGLKATFYVRSGAIGTGSTYLTVADLQSMQAAGHEIGGHTIDHLDLTTLSAASKQHQACDDRARLVGWGLNVVSFAYPFGSVDSASESVVRGCGYSSGRIVGDLACSGCAKAESVPPADPLAVRTPGSIKSNTKLAAIEKYVTDAEAAGGGWVPLVLHHVCSGPGCDSYSISSTTLAAFTDWLKSRAGQGTVVRTVAQVMGGGVQAMGELAAAAPEAAPLGPQAGTAAARQASSADLADVRVFPNPWRVDRHEGSAITIDHLTAASEVRIYTASGRWVRTIASASGAGRWDLRNDAGQRVASGIYLYLVTDSAGRHSRGTLAVVR